MLKSRLCGEKEVYILVKETITITEAQANAAGRNADKRNKQITLKNSTPLTDCISEINNT